MTPSFASEFPSQPLESLPLSVDELSSDGIRGWVSLEYYEDLRRKVQNNALPWTSLYFVNPRASWLDVQFILITVAVLAGTRQLIFGKGLMRAGSCTSFLKYFAVKTRIVREGKLEKFSEVSWYVCWHFTATCWGLWLLYKEAGTPESPGWVRHLRTHPDGRWYWFATDADLAVGSTGWPLLLPSDSLRYFYLTQASFWISCAVYFAVETRRSDDLAFVLHHGATIFLVLFSYVCSYWRLGLVILILHDVVDVFLYTSKALRYTVLPTILTEAAFVGLLLSYFTARLLLFPLFCVRPVVDLRHISILLPHRHVYSSFFPGGLFLPALLVLLQLLHIYWFVLIIRMTARVVKAKRQGALDELEDLRSEPDTDVSPEKQE